MVQIDVVASLRNLDESFFFFLDVRTSKLRINIITLPIYLHEKVFPSPHTSTNNVAVALLDLYSFICLLKF